MERKMPRIWWIRWRDGTINTCKGSYEEALRIAEERGIDFTII